MNEDSLLKKIEKLINPIRGDVSSLKGNVSSLKSDLKSVKKIQKKQTQDITTIKETQESHTSSLLKIETTINVYGDMYKINDGNIRKIEKRTETLEKNAGIETPDELTLLKVQ